MPLIPANKTAAINFFASHLDAWADDPGAIGMTAQQVADLAAAADEARATLLAAEEAYNAARSAMATNDAAIAAMRAAGSGAIATIRAFARAAGEGGDGGAGVYAKAKIPAPKAPSPAGVPEAPTHVRGAIDSRGAIVLRWRGSLADRAFFEVYRMFEGQDEWTLLAAVGTKSFLDDSIPPGSAPAVSYFVQARRGALRGEPSETITVRVGVVPIDRNPPAVGERVGEGVGAGSPGTRRVA